MFIYYYSYWGRLMEAEFLTSRIPELVTVCEDFWSFHAIHHDDAIIIQHS